MPDYFQWRSHPWRALYAALSVFALIAISCFLFFRPGMEGDTQALANHSLKALECVRAGKWGNCPEAGPFTILQYIPAWIIELLGGSKGVVLHFLAYLSMLTGVLSFFEIYRTLKARDESLAWVGVLLLMTGFWIRYINLSSNEMLSSFLILMAVTSVLRQRSLLTTAFYFWASSLTKDMAGIFLIFWMGVTVLFVSQARLSWKSAMKLSLAVVLGMLCNIGFNLFRFGTVMNQGYMNPEFFIHDLGLQTSFFLAQWFSPSGGLWIFWTSFCIGMALAALILFRVRSWSMRVPVLSVFVIFGALTLGFSKWYSPMGGYCWGVRFFLPWIPALSCYLFWVYDEEFKALLRVWVSRAAWFWAGGFVLAVTSFPQYQFLFRQSLIGRVLSPAACNGRAQWDYYNCVLWQPWPWGIVSFFAPYPRPDLFLLSTLLASWVVVVCLKIRRAL
jgi:hypothetical protein